jgi:hypothetical protein
MAMRSVLAFCLAAAETRFYVASPPAVRAPPSSGLALQQQVVWVPAADVNGFLAMQDPRLRRGAVYMQEAPPPPPQKFGATVDQDGKSNVWAVEPTMKTESGDKGLLKYLPVVAVAAIALISIPLLPTLFAANPDQV